jgi:hypothetical protein
MTENISSAASKVEKICGHLLISEPIVMEASLNVFYSNG